MLAAGEASTLGALKHQTSVCILCTHINGGHGERGDADGDADAAYPRGEMSWPTRAVRMLGCILEGILDASCGRGGGWGVVVLCTLYTKLNESSNREGVWWRI